MTDITKETLLAEGLKRIETKREGPTEAARAVLSEAGALPPELAAELCVIGLAHLCGYRYADFRRGRKPTPSLERALAQKTGEMAAKVGKAVQDHTLRVLESITWHVRGKMRPLSELTGGDLANCSRDAHHRAVSWRAREAWFQLASDALNKHKVASVGALPETAKRTVALAAAKAWRDESPRAARKTGAGAKTGAKETRRAA